MEVLTDIEVLRETIARLKTKTLNSKRRFHESSQEKMKYVTGLRNIVEETREEFEDSKISDTVLLYLNDAIRVLFDLISETKNLLEDFDLYVSILESYYAKKDEQLQKAIERGKEQAEKEKEQEEAIKKRPVDYAK